MKKLIHLPQYTQWWKSFATKQTLTPRLTPRLPPIHNTKVIVGMSGGVDSSVTAFLLKNAGFDVHGVFMQNWDFGDETGSSFTCPASRDFGDVRQVCDHIGIPCHHVDFVKEYWNNVFTPYLDRFKSGGTPNPDVFCNREIKFKVFRDHVMSNLGADFIATGHYVQLDASQDRFRLIKGVDPGKDQTYFLSAVPGENFANALFPLGCLNKTEVREIARHAELPTAEKKESYGICFVGKRNFGDFISDYVDQEPGDFVDLDGNMLGTHNGLHSYTIGQGAKLGGQREPYFVVEKRSSTNEIVIAPANHPRLLYKGLEIQASEMFWINSACAQELSNRTTLSCRYRYRDEFASCRVHVDPDTHHVRVTFDSPRKAVASQQIAAIYDGIECLGGGIIDKTFHA